MKDIYDVLLNFKSIAYEIYEWNSDDEINHIKKIPIIKVNEKTLKDFLNCNLTVNNNFLCNIKDKTQKFIKNEIKTIEYACILFSDYLAVAVMFDSLGNTIGKSKLLFEEMDDLILSGYNLEEKNIDYKINFKIEYNTSFTRKEHKLAKKLTNYINKIYESKKYDELKYIYLDCFNKEEENLEKIYNKILESIRCADYNILFKLSSFLKVLKK